MRKTAKDLIAALSSGPVRKYISEHENEDIARAILKHKEILGIPTASLFEQIATRRKARLKLPLYYSTEGIIFPPPVNFEQCSSQTTALFKCEALVRLAGGKGFRGADLTGGFGVDTYFMSTVAETMIHVEPDTSLSDLARHSHRLLGAMNITYKQDTAENFLKTSGNVDFVYMDPSRRTTKGRKVHSLKDAQPDVLQLIDLIFSKTSLLLLKASPMLDIQGAIKNLPGTRIVFVVSVDNECKELLFICEKGFSGGVEVSAVDLDPGGTRQEFDFTFQEEQKQEVSCSDPLDYLYEPNASILKAGAFRTVAGRFGLKKLHPNTHLYTSAQKIENFPGRKFRIAALVKPDRAEVAKHIPGRKANVATRNYPLTAEELKKKTGLSDGGDQFVFGFKGPKKNFVAIAEKI